MIDPVIASLKMWTLRFVWLGTIALTIGLAVWRWVLNSHYLYYPTVFQFVSTIENVLEDEKSDRLLIFQGAIVIGILSAVTIFLVIALLWRRSGDVVRRGSHKSHD